MSDDKRERAREILDAIAEGDEIDRAIKAGELATWPIVEFYEHDAEVRLAVMREAMPAGIGSHINCAETCALLWLAPPMAIEAFKKSRAYREALARLSTSPSTPYL